MSLPVTDPASPGDLRNPVDVGHVAREVVEMHFYLGACGAKGLGDLIAADLMVKKEC